jgi:transcriptional regulator with XRE-family HTH domain
METIGDYLRNWRGTKGFSQEQVAERLGVSQTTYNRWESGKRLVPYKYYTAIAKIMEVKLSDLVPDNVTANIANELNTQEVLTLDVKDFLRVLEDNNGLLKLRCERLEEENIRLFEENSAFRTKLSG